MKKEILITLLSRILFIGCSDPHPNLGFTSAKKDNRKEDVKRKWYLTLSTRQVHTKNVASEFRQIRLLHSSQTGRSVCCRRGWTLAVPVSLSFPLHHT